MMPALALLLLLQGPAPVPADTGVIRLGARTIATLRAPVGASTARERAVAAETRIAHLLELGADSVSLEPQHDGVLVRLGGERAFMVVLDDVDTLAGATVAGAAEAAATQLQAGVRDDLEARSVRALAIAIGLAAAATLLLLLGLRILLRLRRWLDGRASQLRQASLPAPLRRLAGVFDLRLAVRPIHLLTSAGMWTLGLSLCYLYVTFVLTRFPWTRPWGEQLGEVLLDLLRRLGAGALHFLPKLAVVVLIFLGTRLLARGVHRLFTAVRAGTLTIPGVHPETAEPTRRIVTVLLWLFAVVVAYPYLPGSDSAAFKGVSVFAGLLLSLGSAGLVGQAMSGLVLMYARSYRPGDYVRIGEVEGVVQELGMLSTRLRTPKDEYVVVPNTVATAQGVTNYSAAGRAGHPILLHSSITIGYDVPRARVESLLLDAARRLEGAPGSPAPFVLLRALNDWYVEYQVNVPLDPTRAAGLPQFYSALHAAIYDAFAEAGVEIMSPSYFALRDGNARTVPGPAGAAPAPPGRPA